MSFLEARNGIEASSGLPSALGNLTALIYPRRWLVAFLDVGRRFLVC